MTSFKRDPETYDHMSDAQLADYIFVHTLASASHLHPATFAVLAATVRRLKRSKLGPMEGEDAPPKEKDAAAGGNE